MIRQRSAANRSDRASAPRPAACRRAKIKAWVEMARGLLMQQVHLDSAAPVACLLGCRVLAPTDWNFHLLGPVAQVLETLPKTITIQRLCRVVTLMTAYDPCVRFNLPKLMTPAETFNA